MGEKINPTDQICIKAVETVLNNWREIDEATGKAYGWEVAIALLGTDCINKYIDEYGIQPPDWGTTDIRPATD